MSVSLGIRVLSCEMEKVEKTLAFSHRADGSMRETKEERRPLGGVERAVNAAPFRMSREKVERNATLSNRSGAEISFERVQQSKAR